jgi:hypothetical protein
MKRCMVVCCMIRMRYGDDDYGGGSCHANDDDDDGDADADND